VKLLGTFPRNLFLLLTSQLNVDRIGAQGKVEDEKATSNSQDFLRSRRSSEA
jgi:hypothetical protein